MCVYVCVCVCVHARVHVHVYLHMRVICVYRKGLRNVTLHELDWRGWGLQRCSMHVDVTAMNNVAGLFGVCNYEYLDSNNKSH